MLLGSKISVIVGTRAVEKTNIYQHVILQSKDLEIVNLTIILIQYDFSFSKFEHQIYLAHVVLISM